MATKLFEGLLASYTTNDRYEYKYQAFNLFYLLIAIHHIPSKELKNLFTKYKPDNLLLTLSDHSPDEFVNIAINFFSSNHKKYKSLISTPSKKELFHHQQNKSRFFEFKCGNIFNNLLLLLAYADLTDVSNEKLQNLFTNILDFIKVDTQLQIYSLDFFKIFISKKVHLFEESLLKDLIETAIGDNLWSDDLAASLSKNLRAHHPKYRINNKRLVEKIIGRVSERDRYHVRLKSLIPFYHVIDSDCQPIFLEAIKNQIYKPDRFNKSTDNYINWDFFFATVNQEILPITHDKLFQRFIKEKIHLFRNFKIEKLNEHHLFNNRKVYACVYWFHKLKISPKKVKNILEDEKVPLHLKWALDAKNFDYDKFDVNWLLAYDDEVILDSIFIEEKRTLLEKLKFSLNKNYSNRLAKMCFRYFKL